MIEKYHPSLRMHTASDMRQILEIEETTADFPWTRSIIAKFAVKTQHKIFVLHGQGVVLGYAFAHIGKDNYNIIKLVAHPKFGYEAWGCILNRLKKKLSIDRKKKIMISVAETDLESQVWLRDEAGFKVVDVQKDMFQKLGSNDNVDGYIFQYSLFKG